MNNRLLVFSRQDVASFHNEVRCTVSLMMIISGRS